MKKRTECYPQRKIKKKKIRGSLHPIDVSITIDDRFGDRKAPPDLSMENREKKILL